MKLRVVLAILALSSTASPCWGQVPPFITSWGGFGTGDGQFKTPVGVGVDADGFVYVVDTNVPRIQRFTRTGTYVSQWPCSDARDVEVGPDGCVYVLRTGLISKYSTTGVLLSGWAARNGSSIAVDVDGSVWTSSGYDGGVVSRYTNSGVLLSEWAAHLAPGFPGLDDLDGVAVDGRGHFYTVQRSEALVRKFTMTGSLVAQWGAFGVGNGQFNWPVRIATSPDGTKVYVVDYQNSRIQVFSDTGSYLGQWGIAGSGPGQFLNPIGIGVDRDGNVYVADTNNSRIQLFGDVVTSTRPISWADLKRRYR